MSRSPVLTPQIPTFRTTFGYCSSLHLHPPWPRTSHRMPRDTPLSRLSTPASTSLRLLLRPSCLMSRSPVLTPQIPTFRTTFGYCSSLHFRSPTCHLPWPQILRIFSLPIRTFSLNRRLISDFATFSSATSTQPMRLQPGNHLIYPLWPQERQRMTSLLKCWPLASSNHPNHPKPLLSA